VDLMICYFVIFISTSVIEWFFLSVQDSGCLRMSMASMDLLGLWIESVATTLPQPTSTRVVDQTVG
jgi:hypothetical protein